MKGMDKAVNRIIKNIKSGKPIAVVGDYDLDGVSAVSLLKLGIEHLGGKVISFIPNRKNDGHGIPKRFLIESIKKGVDLYLTCDFGINQVNTIKEINTHGLDCILTDHHLSEAILPPAFSILNPNQKGCDYPFKDLSGSGVAFMLINGLNAKYKNSNILIEKIIDIAAIGTVADQVPLKGENRLLVKYGFEKIRNKSRLCFKSLSKYIKFTNLDKINVSSFNYKIAPILNAPGRIDDANIVVDFLTNENSFKMKSIIKKLLALNKKRQFIQKNSIQDAANMASSFNKKKLIILENSSWHPGIIGIIAANIKNKFNMPTIIITFDKNGNGNGSSRSPKNVNIYDILYKFKKYFETFGGHSSAAGFTLKKKHYVAFKQSINTYFSNTKFKVLEKKLVLDGKLELNDINYEFIKSLDYLAPFGPGNPKPRFALEQLNVIGNPIVIAGDSLLRFQVKKNNKTMDVLAFGISDFYTNLILGELVDIAGYPEINLWRGRKKIQFNAQAIRLSKT
jgi:single-stranded-DNA-specific exonuclease